MWRDTLRQILVALGIIRRPDLVGRTSDRHPTPDELPAGLVIVVKDGGRAKWACLRCPGGCGEKLQLSLNANRRPSWATVFDWLRRPTVSPSVRQLSACRCHFWIKGGAVEWCADSGRRS
ncbi:DUF6527 family protein [Leptospira interrogans]